MVIKSTGDGVLVIKTWVLFVGLIITCISVGFNVAHIVGISAIQDKVYTIECQIKDSEVTIKENREFFHKLDKDIAEIKMLLK